MEARTTLLTSATKQVVIHRERPTVIIGERINPTGRKQILTALEEGNFELIRRGCRCAGAGRRRGAGCERRRARDG